MKEQGQIKVFIVDDHPLIRMGVRQLFEGECGMRVCGEAETLRDALALVKTCLPDICVIDISLPDGSGLDLVKRIKAALPDMPVLMSSMHDEELFAERALRAGAMGYINKQEASEHLVEAVKQILKGKIYVSPRMTQKLLQQGANKTIGRGGLEALSDREMEVFEQIGRGNGTASIARNLNLSVKTVETHRAHIKQKLGLESATELARRAIQWSLEEI